MALILQERVSLKPFNSFGIDVRAAWLARVECEEDLQRLRADARVRDLPRLVLGAGSNVLFAADFDGLVVRMESRGVDDLDPSDGVDRIRVAAGEEWAALVERMVREGRPGLENLALIPGLAGAAPIQNIGAYGIELAERLESVRVWDWEQGESRSLTTQECGLGYRDSVFKHDRDGARIVLDITLLLPRPWVAVTGYAELERELAARACANPGSTDIFEAVCALRRRKLPDPRVLGNAGSFFKNPVVDRERHAHLIEHFPSLVSYPLGGGRFKIGAGWLIDACGWKGVARGRAGVFEKQALVLVNRGGSSGKELLALSREIQSSVSERFGIELEPEVRVVSG